MAVGLLLQEARNQEGAQEKVGLTMETNRLTRITKIRFRVWGLGFRV